MEIDIQGETIQTTLAQLNFIRWLINHDVLVYLEENRDKILEIQKSSQHPSSPTGSEGTPSGKKKKKGYHMTNLEARVVFD